MSESPKKAGEDVREDWPKDGRDESKGDSHSMTERDHFNEELQHDPDMAQLLNSLEQDRSQADREMALSLEADIADRLEFALRDGHRKGRRRSVTARRTRIGFQMVALAICLMLTLTAFVRISPAFAAIVKEIPGFGRFVELVSYDRSLMNALNHEYFQLVNQSDERNGYTFTVNGVIADSQRVVVLYTAEGPGITEENTTFLPYKLKDGSGADLQAMSMSSHFFREATQKEGIVQDYLDIRMQPGETIPRELDVMMKLGEEWLEVQVAINHEKFAELEETFDLNQTIEIAGQKITPLQVTVDFEGDPANQKRLVDFIDLRLVDDRGRSYATQSGMGDLEGSLRRHFQIGAFEKVKSLTLTARGLMMNDRDLKVVIDTDQKLLISAPDERLSLGEANMRKDGIDLRFDMRLNTPIEGASYGGYRLFQYGGTFRDASGKAYPIEYGDTLGQNYVSIRISEEETGHYYFHIPNEDYAQPLTLDVDQYYGYVLQDLSVLIK
ncbi:DUF4179 domain-containing protein [Paenibacillus pinisoli]|uniref:DUF4179 domain-containing protein n=1 Tax=Paenibacillus pinisoli TaxID=1276110 RepID=A0A3A6Q328_9BACL|nr:DUF4179 domain-containing protein [Paenibacillus pinisoli]RJX40334.1 DUF4179 domain-containing protein [Paenibacillus pinisoli]